MISSTPAKLSLLGVVLFLSGAAWGEIHHYLLRSRMPADWVFVDIELHPVARALIIGGLLPAAAGIAFAAAQFLVNRMSGRRP